MSIENEFKCYKYWTVPFLLDSFRKSNKELDEKLNELVGDFAMNARIVDYIVREESLISGDKILNFISEEDCPPPYSQYEG